MNESVYLNSKEHEFVCSKVGKTFSQKLRFVIRLQMSQEGFLSEEQEKEVE